MNLLFPKTPTLFGPFHIGMLFVILIVVVLFARSIRPYEETRLIRMLHRLGLVMILMEIWKQWFTLRYVFDGVYNMWFFPWQLCSMAMYCSFLLPFLKTRAQNVLLVFLESFSFFAAIMALAVPSDMLRPQVFLCLHGFVYHGIMLMESILAFLILKKRGGAPFFPSVLLFLGMSAVAEALNVFGHEVLKGRWPEPNMFYITPYYPSTQLVCSYVAEQLGIIPEVILYTIAIILFSLIFYLIEEVIRKRCI